MNLTKLYTLLFTFLICLYALPILSHGGEGGSHTNGGGSIKVSDKNWVSVANIDINSLRSNSNVREILDVFKELHPEVKFGVCKNNKSLLLLELSNPLSKYIKFLKETNNNVSSLTIKDLCTSKKLNDAYLDFVVTLYWLMNNDEVAKHLINQFMKFRVKMNIGISENPKKVSVIKSDSKGFDHILESTWFDEEKYILFWTKQPEKTGMDVFLGRGSPTLLLHELVHVLQKVIYNGDYPTKSKWHSNITIDTEYLMDKTWLKNKTSEDAAFIEGLANAIEAGESHIEHPYIYKYGSFFGMEKDGCISYRSEVLLENRSIFTGDVHVPLDNEIFISSTLSMLTYYGGELKINRVKKLIDILIKYKPKNIKDLALAVDIEFGGSIGYSWYREYYFENLYTGKNISSEFNFSNKEEFLSYGSVCLKNKSDSKYSYYQTQEDRPREQKLLNQSKLEAIKKNDEFLKKEINNTLLYTPNYSRKEIYQNQDLLKIRQILKSKIKPEACKEKALINAEESLDNIGVKVYHYLEGITVSDVPFLTAIFGVKSAKTIPINYIYSYVQEIYCKNFQDGAFKDQKLLSESIVKIKKISNLKTILGSDAHFKKVQEIESLSFQIKSAKNRLLDRLWVSYALSKLFLSKLN